MRGGSSSRFWATSVLAALAALALLGARAAAAATYKWVDDQGVVHYSDKVPPEAQTKGAQVLDKQGRPVKKIEPAPTPEERRAQEAEEARKRAAAKVAEERARKDRALMLSYTTEAEIDVARNRALTTIDTQIKGAQAYSAELAKRQQALLARKAALGDKPTPIELERELNTVDIELSRQNTLIEQKKAEAVSVAAKYDEEKKRWEAIKADQQRAAAAAAAPTEAQTQTKGTPARAPVGTPTAAKK